MLHSPRDDRRRSPTPLQVVGELLLTAALLVGLFLVWKLWWFNDLTAAHQQVAADDWLRSWAPARTAPGAEDAPPVVEAAPRHAGEVIGVLRVPRFGAAYARTIAEGTGADELSSFRTGVGHYQGTAMPGGVGNFAIAGHRDAYGGAMHELDALRPGDRIEVDTAAGRYVYRFRSLRTVLPTAIGVLDAVPGHAGAHPSERLITLTTCTPMYTAEFRLVAVGVLVGFTPRSQR